MLNQAYILKNTDKTYFNMNGHVFLEDVLSKDDLQLYREAINRWAKDFRAKQKSLAERDTYGKAFLQMMTSHLRGHTQNMFRVKRLNY